LYVTPLLGDVPLDRRNFWLFLPFSLHFFQTDLASSVHTFSSSSGGHFFASDQLAFPAFFLGSIAVCVPSPLFWQSPTPGCHCFNLAVHCSFQFRPSVAVAICLVYDFLEGITRGASLVCQSFYSFPAFFFGRRRSLFPFSPASPFLFCSFSVAVNPFSFSDVFYYLFGSSPL